MFTRLTNLLKKRLMQNIMALYSVQVVNSILPLIVIPYLTRILGAEQWGVYAYYQSIALLMVNAVEYSFAQYATREVSRFRDQTEALSHFFSGVLCAKLLLISIFVVVSAVSYALIPELQQHRVVFLWALLWAFTLGLNLIWYFQGLEKLHIAAGLDVLMKLLATLAILVWVKQRDDVWLVFALYAAANALSMLTAFFIAIRPLKRLELSFTRGFTQLKLGFPLFFSRAMINIYSTSTLFLLGFFTTKTELGYYAGAEKIVRALLVLYTPINNALYPRLSLWANEANPKAKRLLGYGFLTLTSIGLIFGLLLFIFAPKLSVLLLGVDFAASAFYLRILSLLPILVALSNVIGLQWMLPNGYDKEFQWIVSLAALFYLLIGTLFSYLWQGVGMAVAVVLTEIVIVLFMALVYWRATLTHTTE